MATPNSKMLTFQGLAAKKAFGNYFEAKELSAISQTCKHNREIHKHNCKTSELLFYSVNINKERKKKLLELLSVQNSEKSNDRSVILTQAHGRQVYFSNNTTVCIRMLTNMSPLEAAVLSGDFHLVRILLKNLPDNQNEEAILQLKRIIANLDIDPRSFVSLNINLQKAYDKYNSNYNTLWAAENWKELDKLSGMIGEGQKALPWFILQVFCRRVQNDQWLQPFGLTQEPDRECILDNDLPLDLDLIGFRNNNALIKKSVIPIPNQYSPNKMTPGAMYSSLWFWPDDPDDMEVNNQDSPDILCLGDNAGSIDFLCLIIKSELGEIVKLQEEKLKFTKLPACFA